MMPAVGTNRSYSKLPDTELTKFFGGTIKGLTRNPDPDKPPVDPVDAR
jgi:hypothetical protein